MLNKTLLGSAAVIMTMVGAQAADLPSKKAAPATYVKICDAYGAGFYTIPGTDTCVKIGGYVRAEYQYVPGQLTYKLGLSASGANLAGAAGNTANAGNPAYAVVGASAALKSSTVDAAMASSAAATAATTYLNWTNPAGTMTTTTTTTAGTGTTPAIVSTSVSTTTAAALYQASGTKIGSIIQSFGENADAQSTSGSEMRGRIDVDARTPSSMGTVRTFVRIRLANTSGIRNSVAVNNANYTQGVASTTGASLESALIQWAGFTFGVAPENYAMMPSMIYNANPWAGFPNGMKQLAYTHSFGGGVSATLALEDAQDMGYAAQYRDTSTTSALIVGNVRLDQSWGFAAVHGMVGNNGVQKNWVNHTWVAPAMSSDGSQNLAGYGYVAPFSGFNAPAASAAISTGVTTKSGWALGTTVNIKLPMIAAGDQMWVSANYADGQLGALLSSGGLNTVASASAKRIMGGLVRVDTNLQVTSSSTFDSVKGWSAAAAYTHYWTNNWRSNFSAGYVEINPPTVKDASAGIQWGKGQLQLYTAGLVYSPVQNFDLGLEFQYTSLKNQVQNWTAVSGGTIPALEGLKVNNYTTKFRVERTF